MPCRGDDINFPYLLSAWPPLAQGNPVHPLHPCRNLPLLRRGPFAVGNTKSLAYISIMLRSFSSASGLRPRGWQVSRRSSRHRPDAIVLTGDDRADVNLGTVADGRLTSDMTLRKLVATEWVGGSITAPVIGALRITGGASSRGDLSADLTLTGDPAPRFRSLGSMTVKGVFSDATLASNASLGDLTYGALEDVNILAGVDNGVVRAGDRTDFAAPTDNLLASINSLTVTGLAGRTHSYSNSNVTAWRLGTMKLSDVDASSGNDTFGLTSNSIGSYAPYQDGHRGRARGRPTTATTSRSFGSSSCKDERSPETRAPGFPSGGLFLDSIVQIPMLRRPRAPGGPRSLRPSGDRTSRPVRRACSHLW